MTDNLHTITPVTHDLGGFEVRRVLPSKARMMVGPFIFVDQFGPAQLEIGRAMDVRPHPHINLATVSYLFDGAIDHRDSLGTYATIVPGDVNLMTAGKGITHSERSPQSERDAGPTMFGMQTWIALPDNKEEMDPAFENVVAADLPIIRDNGAKARVIMGSLWGQTAPTTCHSPTIYADIGLEPNGSIPIDAEADERGIMLVQGGATLDGASLEPYTLYVLKLGQIMTLSSAEGGRIMLLGGAAFTTPRYQWWNFVSSSKDRIMEARQQWADEKFPLVPGDTEERIPVPVGAPKING